MFSYFTPSNTFLKDGDEWPQCFLLIVFLLSPGHFDSVMEVLFAKEDDFLASSRMKFKAWL